MIDAVGAADYQAESKSAAAQSGESEIATGDAVTTATAATIEPTITPTETPAAEPDCNSASHTISGTGQ